MSAISAGSAASSAARSNNSDSYSQLTSEQFLEIMITELSYQDPLEPSDSQALLDQISTIRSIESDTSMINELQEVVDQSEFASATTLIGTLISGIDENGARAVDVVLSVSRTADGPVLNLFDGSRVPFDQIDEVVTPNSLTDVIEVDDPPATDDDSVNDDTGGDDTGGDPTNDQGDPTTGSNADPDPDPDPDNDTTNGGG